MPPLLIIIVIILAAIVALLAIVYFLTRKKTPVVVENNPYTPPSKSNTPALTKGLPNMHLEIQPDGGDITVPYYAIRVNGYYYAPNNPEGWLITPIANAPPPPYDNPKWTVQETMEISDPMGKLKTLTQKDGNLKDGDTPIAAFKFLDKGYSNLLYSLALGRGLATFSRPHNLKNNGIETLYHLSVSPHTDYRVTDAKTTCTIAFGNNTYALNKGAGWLQVRGTDYSMAKVLDSITSPELISTGTVSYQDGQLYQGHNAVTSVSWHIGTSNYTAVVEHGQC